jgi:hypothetical protein
MTALLVLGGWAAASVAAAIGIAIVGAVGRRRADDRIHAQRKAARSGQWADYSRMRAR